MPRKVPVRQQTCRVQLNFHRYTGAAPTRVLRNKRTKSCQLAMHLLNVETLRFEDFFGVAQPPPYAILSHTWGEDHEEVSYRDVLDGRLDAPERRPVKVGGCCERAKEDGYRYVWLDSCCIDKTNSVELQEAINSMFRWYQGAPVCYVFLSDVPGSDNPLQNLSPLSSRAGGSKGAGHSRNSWPLQQYASTLQTGVA